MYEAEMGVAKARQWEQIEEESMSILEEVKYHAEGLIKCKRVVAKGSPDDRRIQPDDDGRTNDVRRTFFVNRIQLELTLGTARSRANFKSISLLQC